MLSFEGSIKLADVENYQKQQLSSVLDEAQANTQGVTREESKQNDGSLNEETLELLDADDIEESVSISRFVVLEDLADNEEVSLTKSPILQRQSDSEIHLSQIELSHESESLDFGYFKK